MPLLVLSLVVALALLAGCAPDDGAPDDGAPGGEPTSADEAPQTEADSLIARSIAAHGMGVLDHAEAAFDFRDAHFEVRRQGGQFRYVRTYTDSTGRAIREVLTNDSLYQMADGARQDLTAEERGEVATAVNSVVYFAFLPYFLQDPAVQAQVLGTDTLGGEAYRAVEVTFQEEDGGRDWEDRFVYWFDPETATMDYLAYYFHTGESGSRFREAVDARSVNGVRMQDYRNLTADPDTLGPEALERFAGMQRAGTLDAVSEIRLENVQIRPLPEE